MSTPRVWAPWGRTLVIDSAGGTFDETAGNFDTPGIGTPRVFLAVLFDAAPATFDETAGTFDEAGK